MPDSPDMQQIFSQLDRGEIDHHRFFELFTAELGRLIDCSRAGIWMFVDKAQGRALHCVAMHDRERVAQVSAPDLVSIDVGPYLQALLADGCVVASEVRSHPSTAACLGHYVLPNDIQSLLAVGFSVNGVMCGCFSCEQTGVPRSWTQRELQLLRQIGSRASLVLMHAVNAQIDTAPGALWEPSTPNRLTMPAPLDADKN